MGPFSVLCPGRLLQQIFIISAKVTAQKKLTTNITLIKTLTFGLFSSKTGHIVISNFYINSVSRNRVYYC